MRNFVGLHTALSGLRASQMGLDTASNNVANVGTEGYTRQRVGLQPSLSFPSPVGPLGTGVTVTDISRLRDGFVDARARTALGESASSSTQALLLARTEAIMAEPVNGISAALGTMWDAFEDWALAPSGGAPRRQVVAALDGLASRVRAVSTGWDQLEADTAAQVTNLTEEATRALQQVAELNAAIPLQTALGSPPNDLLDRRDLLADRLAELLGATATTGADGRMRISVGGTPLLDGSDSVTLSATGTGFSVAGGPSDGTALATGGELGAMQRFLSTELPGQRAALDEFTTALVEALHASHGAAGDPPAPALFASRDGGPITAGSITVNPALHADPSLLAAGKGGGLHDARNAEALAQLRSSTTDGQPTLDDRISAQIVGLAGRVAAAGHAAEAEHDLATAAAVARQSAHGVSLDEEMAAIVKYQRSLEAMSRVMTAIDQALDVLVNRTGIVGR